MSVHEVRHVIAPSRALERPHGTHAANPDGHGRSFSDEFRRSKEEEEHDETADTDPDLGTEADDARASEDGEPRAGEFVRSVEPGALETGDADGEGGSGNPGSREAGGERGHLVDRRA